MKRELYSLRNEEFAYFAHLVAEKLTELERPYLIVGGTAVQAYTLEGLCKSNNATVVELDNDRNRRFQDVLRATDDLDLALKFPKDMEDSKKANVIFSFLEGIRGEHLSPNHIIEYRFDRSGHQRPRFSITVDEQQGESVALNISRRPQDLKGLPIEFYDYFIDEGVTLDIPYNSDFLLKLRVPRIEHVIAAKVSHFREKDAADLMSLAKASRLRGELDLGEIEKILLPVYERRYDRFRHLVEEDIPYNPVS